MYQCDKKQVLLTAFLVCVIAIPAGAQTIWHVDDDACPGPGSGTIGDPYCSIQDAMVAAVNGDEILVAPGTYFEEVDFLGKTVTLRSSGGVAVTTIDVSGIGFRPVTCQSGEGPDTILSGFTLTGASGAAVGGGMTIFNSSPTVMNCVFKNNSAGFGGGLGISGGNPAISNCIFSDNTAVSSGGGVYISDSNATLSYCTIKRNSASSVGGGMFIISGSPLIMESTFNFNTSDNIGGGMGMQLNSNPTVTNCAFTGNISALDGGGIGSFNNSSPIIRACIFTSNVADGSGGGVFVSQGAPKVIESTFHGNVALTNFGGGLHSSSAASYIVNCRFEGNVAGQMGGGMNNTNSSSTVVNSIFLDNSADSGGGLSIQAFGGPFIANCTFYNNGAAVNGGGVYNGSLTNPTYSNTIIWGNGPDQLFNDTVTPTVNNCDIQGGIVGGIGNIDADPLFVDAASGDLHLRMGSPCIDAGQGGSMPPDTADLDDDGNLFEPIPFDFDGNNRFVNNFIPDIGAFESDQCDADTDGSGDVNVTDLLALLAAWGPCPSPCPQDFNIDGNVNVTDLLALLAAWGACPL